MHTTSDQIKELGHRHGDGIDVTLLWNSRTDRVFVAGEDNRLGERLEIPVAAAHALDAFHESRRSSRTSITRAIPPDAPIGTECASVAPSRHVGMPSTSCSQE